MLLILQLGSRSACVFWREGPAPALILLEAVCEIVGHDCLQPNLTAYQGNPRPSPWPKPQLAGHGPGGQMPLVRARGLTALRAEDGATLTLTT